MKTFLRILFFFLLVTQICIAQWFWQNPLPQGNNLVGLSFVDENTGWIQDNRGAIYKTINAGQSWTKQHNGNYHYRPVIGYGTIIKFLNETTGWLLEWEDYIATRLLKTTDGGNNWFLQYYNSTFSYSYHYYDFVFVNSNTGWMFGHENIVKTTNGGQSWDTVHTAYTDHMSGASFVNENIGWMATFGGYIRKTVDGGSNWNQQFHSDSLSFNNVFFVDENV